MRMPPSTLSEMRRLDALREGCERAANPNEAERQREEFCEGALELWPLLMGYAEAWAGEQRRAA